MPLAADCNLNFEAWQQFILACSLPPTGVSHSMFIAVSYASSLQGISVVKLNLKRSSAGDQLTLLGTNTRVPREARAIVQACCKSGKESFIPLHGALDLHMSN